MVCSGPLRWGAHWGCSGSDGVIARTLRSSSLGSIHGIPRVHFKGRQGDYYVMACPCPRSALCPRLHAHQCA